jgi:hemerythrin-like metal-binding protein
MKIDMDLLITVKQLHELHGELIDRRSGLISSIREQVCKYTIKHLIVSLEESVADCFIAEENNMQRHGYSEYLRHKAEHERFRDDLHELKRVMISLSPDKKCGSYELAVELNSIMADFIVDHITNTDKKLGAFLEGKRLAPFLYPQQKIIHRSQFII